MSKKWIPVLICIVILVGVIGVMQWKASFADEEMVNRAQTTATTTEDINSAVASVEDNDTTVDNANTEDSSTPSEGAMSPTYSVEANGALSVGNPDAPVTLLEFSSFSCPHCATFHNSVLAPIKKDYVDTGKVRIVFMDFPLNRQALDASLLGRCIDTSNRYDFMNMLFEQQNQWAFEGDHRDKLVQYASLVGLSRDKAESCMDDRQTEQDLLAKMKMASERYGINSTPTFVVLPGEQKISGAQSYGAFSQVFESLAAE